jgi:hypothetical protein
MKHMSTRILTAALGTSLLIGCSSAAPQMVMPGNTFNPALSANNAGRSPVASLAMTDNFTQWMAAQQKSRNEGADDTLMGEPIEGQQVATLPRASSTNLTYFTYEALDSNLFQDLNRIIDTLELVGSNAGMNLVAQTDNAGPGNTARYIIQRDANMGSIVSPYLPLKGVEASGDTRVFADSMRWAFGAHPAKINWLNISTHGMGFSGVNYDDNPESSHNIIEFAQAVRQGMNGKKLDIVSFDACLMATVEVASELKDVANILVGSEDSTYYWGYGYYQTFAKIAQNPTAMNPDQVVRSMVLDVHSKGAGNQTLTISATDMRKMGVLEQEMDNLARVLRQALPKYQAPLLMALRASRDFHMAEGIPYRDVNRLLSLIKERVQDPAVREACDRVNNALYRRGVIMFSRQSKLEQGQGRGLSVYLPLDGQVSQLYRQTRFAKSTQWDEFLMDVNALIASGK